MKINKKRQWRKLTQQGHEGKNDNDNKVAAADNRERLVGRDLAQEALIKWRTLADCFQSFRRSDTRASVEALVGPEAVADGDALGPDEDETEGATKRNRKRKKLNQN